MSDDMMARVLAGIERLEKGQDQLRAGLDQLVGRIEALERGQDQLRAGLSELRTGQDQLRADQDRLRTDLIRTRTEIMERIDRLQDALTAQHEGEIVTLGVAERAERMAKSTQDEVRIISEQVNTMFRQIRRLQSDVDALRGEGHA